MGRESGGGGHAQLPAGLLPLGRQLGPGARGGFAHGGALNIKALTCIGQRELARGAVQQGDARLALELTNMLADGRRRHIEQACRRAHAALLYDGCKNRHAFEIIHRAILK